MKKLEDIPKKDLFNVPEGYFDELPGIIQSRIAKSKESRAVSPVFGYALKYAFAVVVIAAVAFFWFQQPGAPQSPESLLASINTEDLVAYLNDDDISTDELLDGVSLDHEDADGIETTVFGQGLENENFDEIFDEID